MELQHIKRSVATTSTPLIYSLEQVQVCFKNQAYDRVMDAKYIADHIGGSYHRLFDGGHDIVGAWKLTGTVSKNEIEHLLGWAKGLWNDAITPRHLPYVTISRETYNKMHTFTGVSKTELYKYMTWSPIEAAGICMSIPSVITKTNVSNIYCHASIGTMLSVLAVQTRSVPAGILATIQVIKVIKTRSFECRKEAISGLLTTTIVIGASMVNPLLGIAVAVSIQLGRSKRVSKKVQQFVKKHTDGEFNKLCSRYNYIKRRFSR